MRPRQIKQYDSIWDAFESPGCPICEFLRNLQTQLLQAENGGDINALCNGHAWAVAAVTDTASAARVFISLLGPQSEGGPDLQKQECTMCARLVQEEATLLSQLTERQNALTKWLRTNSTLCLPHARELRKRLPLLLGGLVDSAVQRRQRELRSALQQLIASADAHQHSGVLGRVAELLVGQRLLPIRQQRSGTHIEI